MLPARLDEMSGAISGRSIPSGQSVQLDLIRAFAILLVIGAPFRISAPDGFAGLFGWAWREWDGFGVPLSFTLSGYLVSGLIFSEVWRYGAIELRPLGQDDR